MLREAPCSRLVRLARGSPNVQSRYVRTTPGKQSMIPPMSVAVLSQLVHLVSVDSVIVVLYFALVLSIGWYLKGRSNTGEDFFMAGREMTAWVAGLSFLSANLGALEL